MLAKLLAQDTYVRLANMDHSNYTRTIWMT